MSRAAKTPTTMMKRRGGLMPAAPPQDWCDACKHPLVEQEAIEVTITQPPTHVPGLITTRLYAHPRCVAGLAERVAAYLVRS